MSALKRCALLIVALSPIQGVVAQADSLSVQADSLSVQTDRAIYGPLDMVSVTFINRGDSTVYLMPDGCRTLDGQPLPRIKFERRVGEAWVPYSSGSVCGGALQEPVPLQPNAPYVVRFQVGLFSPLPLGTYRYVFSIWEDYLRPETLLPEGVATSNAFEVRV